MQKQRLKMKKIYAHLATIIPNFPTTHVMYLGDGDDEFISYLKDLSQKNSFVFDVRVFDGEKYEKIDIDAPKYNTKGYQYDTLFLNLKKVPTKFAKHLFERVYASMKNAGGLILCLPNDDEFACEIEYFLEDLNFVAINPMDLSEDIKIVYAKKMHGWGGSR